MSVAEGRVRAWGSCLMYNGWGWGAVQLGHGEWSHGTLTPMNRQTRLETLPPRKFLAGGKYQN